MDKDVGGEIFYVCGQDTDRRLRSPGDPEREREHQEEDGRPDAMFYGGDLYAHCVEDKRRGGGNQSRADCALEEEVEHVLSSCTRDRGAAKRGVATRFKNQTTPKHARRQTPEKCAGTLCVLRARRRPLLLKNLIRRRLFDVIDDQYVHRSRSRFEL